MPQLAQLATTVHGFYVVSKPVGPTSAGLTNRLKWLLKKHCNQPKGIKIGHGGTLDPLADGLLPIGVGRATKQLQALLEGPKTYTFTLNFGTQTSTDDTEGEVVATSEKRPTEADLRAILPQFTGDISQQPPAFSALKINGQRAYKLARAGEDVQLEPRQVTIYSLKLCESHPNPQPQTPNPLLSSCLLEAQVSKGTYIRALARDIALALGTVGHVTTLTRIQHGPFSLQQAVTYETLDKALQSGDTHTYLLPLDGLPDGRIDTKSHD